MVFYTYMKCEVLILNDTEHEFCRVHAVIVCDDAKYFHDHVNETLNELGLTDVRSEEILDIIEGYKGRGYGLSMQDELGLCHIFFLFSK